MPNRNFYENLKILENISNIHDDDFFSDIPEDWIVVVTDVSNSTSAINNGKYKDVNMIGAITIISVLNIDREFEIPFVFGGDGVFLIIPSFLKKNVEQVLLKVKFLAKENYSLDLRVGLISSKDIYAEGKEIKIAKLKKSDDYSQAIVKGGGLDYCEYMLKNSFKYTLNVKEEIDFQLNLDGLECRWEEIKSPKDEVLSILLKAKDETTYIRIFENLEKILGDVSFRNPIVENNLKLSFKNENLTCEASAFTNNWLKKSFLILKLKFINLIGKFLINKEVNEWKNYKSRIISTTDTEKFDDMLRMTVSSTFVQTKKLEDYLENEFRLRNIAYGIHKTDSSLMTCLIFERHGKHVHFVDGTNGGYAMASKMFKDKINV